MDWPVWNMDDKLKKYVNKLSECIDTILLGRKMTDGFILYWLDVVSKPDDPWHALGALNLDDNRKEYVNITKF